MLRITIHEPEGTATMRMTLEGRVAGPWAMELDRVWAGTFPRLGRRRLIIDLSDVTYADSVGKSVLVRILSHGNAEVIASSLQTYDLAQEVTRLYQRA
ncbi:MAG: hypothetical protein P4L40_23720 [Terracidiphilus sp.]|nr:hypothetical protein [Terracidiphilus sp.]